MRQAVLAFNFLSIIYAIVTGLLVLSLTTMVAVDFMNIGVIPKTAVLVVVLLPVNMLSVSGLKRRKSWAYVICSACVLISRYCLPNGQQPGQCGWINFRLVTGAIGADTLYRLRFL